MKKLFLIVLALLIPFGALAYEQGEPVDDFELELTDGTFIKLSDCLGKIVIVDEWGSWCSICIKYSMPALDRIAEEYPDDVVVISVNGGEKAETVKFIAEKKNYMFNVAIDERMDILNNYFPTNGIPYCVFIDREGNYYTDVTGAQSEESAYETYINIINEIDGLD